LRYYIDGICPGCFAAMPSFFLAVPHDDPNNIGGDTPALSFSPFDIYCGKKCL
jgi:hypothetical protein